MLGFELFDLDNNKIVPDSITAYQLSKNMDAPCDGLRLSFVSSNSLPELYMARAYNNGELIFNGYIDTQREQLDKGGYQSFIYARSSACLLVDNEAEPRSYKKPSVASLFFINAQGLGFESKLPNFSCSADYVVGKGTSCYDAINDMVNGVLGKSIIVNPNNQLVLSNDDALYDLQEYNILSERRVINRGDAISMIDYKTAGDFAYNHHFESKFVESKRILRKRKMNVSTLPSWQQDYTLKNRIKNSCTGYNAIDFVLDGAVLLPLNSGVCYHSKYLGEISDYYISACQIICDSKGERTKITVNKNISLEEVSYVAK